jgi:type II secretory pathway pseudopilin PulG
MMTTQSTIESTGTEASLASRRGRTRAGMTLIEVVVACTLLAVTITALAGVSLRMGQRSRSNAIVEQRTAVYFQEVNRVESLPYIMFDSTGVGGHYLQSDSVYSGKGYYVWSYSVGPEITTTTPGVPNYRDITLTVTPRLAPTMTQVGVIRRSKSPYVNPLNQ